MSYTFEKGKSYYANPTIKDAKKIIVACTGRRGGMATFTRVDMLKRVEVGHFDGRETAMIRADNGIDYFVSSAVDVDLENASEVIEALK